ncbi:MAG: hypothetical protein R3A48_11545 [Polyangiales bacterium]
MRTLTLALASALALSACHRHRGRARPAPRAWRWENPSPQGNKLNAACVDDAGVGYAAGDFGALLVRDARGAWRAAEVATTAHLRAVACGASEVLAVGDGGVALRSRDHGRTWRRVSLGTRADLHAAQIHAGVTLVAGAGGALLRGADSAHLAAVQGVTTDNLNAVWTDGALAIAAGQGGALLRSDDGGARWRRVESGTQRTLTAVWGSGRDDLYAVGAGGVILVSADGGAGWTVLPRSTSDDLRAVRGRGRRDVYVVGSSGVVLHTRDGVQFIQEASNAPGDLLGLALRGDDVFAVGVRGSITTRDATGRWRLLPGGHRGTLHAVWRGRDGTACAAGQGGVILCQDPTLGWVPAPSGVRANLAGIAGDDAGVLVAVGDYGTVIRSVNNGRAWTLLPTGEQGTLAPDDTSPTWAQLPTRQNRALSAVWLSPEGRGLIVGRDGITLRTSDHGATWQRVRHAFNDGLFGVWGLSDGRAWACGVGGTVLHSSDHGATWQKLPQTHPQDLFAVWSDAGETLAVGRAGTLLRAADGTHFTPIETGITTPILSIAGRGDDRWVASVNGQLLRVRRGATRLTPEAVRTGDDFTAVHAAPDGGLTLVGYWGTVLSSR